jgi:hypothetical protein
MPLRQLGEVVGMFYPTFLSCAVAGTLAAFRTRRSCVRLFAQVLLLTLLHGTSWGAGPGNAQTIANLSEQASGLVFVAASNGDWGNPDACTNSDRFILDRQAPARKELLALVLSAHLQGRTIRAFFSGCTAVGSGGTTFPTAVSITLF